MSIASRCSYFRTGQRTWLRPPQAPHRIAANPEATGAVRPMASRRGRERSLATRLHLPWRRDHADRCARAAAMPASRETPVTSATRPESGLAVLMAGESFRWAGSHSARARAGELGDRSWSGFACCQMVSARDGAAAGIECNFVGCMSTDSLSLLLFPNRTTHMVETDVPRRKHQHRHCREPRVSTRCTGS